MTAEEILKEVVDSTGVGEQQILGKLKYPEVVSARTTVVVRLVNELGWSQSRAARWVNRDSSTINYHLKKMNARELCDRIDAYGLDDE